MSLPRHRPILAIFGAPLLLAFSLSALLASARELVHTARDADVLDYASSLERGAAPDAEYLSHFVRDHEVSSTPLDCGDSITRSRLTIALAAHQSAIKSQSIGLIDLGIKTALRASEDRLTCNPLDGNAWLQLARLRSLAEGPRPDIVEDLKVSWLTAPSESWIMGPRLDFTTGLLLAGVPDLDLGYSADLNRFVQFEPTARISSLYVDQSAWVRLRLRSLITNAPKARKDAIISEIDRLGVDFRKP